MLYGFVSSHCYTGLFCSLFCILCAGFGGFGAAPASTGFGAPAASTGFGGFGAAPATSGFGAPASTGFGAPAASTGFGGFGAVQQQPQAKGSRIKRFESTTEKVGTGAAATISYYLSITAMPEYQNKSFEELRWEDMDGAPSTGTDTSAGSLFGSTTTTGGFGAAPAATTTTGKQ